MVIFLNERSARIRKINRAKELLTLRKVIKKEQNFNVVFTSDSTNESLKITIKNLVYISSQANYACLFVNENSVLKEYVIRTTLKKIEHTLVNYNTFYRCHKSYIINADFVNSIEGNARGYQLLLSVSDKKIPVSRSFPKELLKNILK